MIHARTVGEVLELAERDGETACLVLEDAAAIAVALVRRRYRIQEADADDLRHDAYLAATANRFAALRRGSSDTPAVAWLAGIVKNLWRRRRRSSARGPRLSSELDTCAARDDQTSGASRRPARDERSLAALIDRLPPEQRRVERALLEAGSERGAAELLGVSRDHVHDVDRRARARLSRGPASREAAIDRTWAREAAVRAGLSGDVDNERVLRLYAGGRSRRDIAEATGLSRKAVKERIARAKRRERAPPPCGAQRG